jgi:predicted ATP-dependent protease
MRKTTHTLDVADLLREPPRARESGQSVVQAADVQKSIDTQIRRQGRLRDRLYESILRNTLVISTSGEVAGQVNGLSVIQLGNFAFAQPTRITATTRLGEGKLINIERRSSQAPYTPRGADSFLLPRRALCKPAAGAFCQPGV